MTDTPDAVKQEELARESGLLRCPFCDAAAAEGCIEDGDSLDNGGHFIQCTEAACGATTSLRFACGDDPKPLLREQWNRRAAITLNEDDADNLNLTNVLLRRREDTIDRLVAERDHLHSTLREAIAALDVAAIALDTAGDKLAASVAAAAIGNARRGLGDGL